MTDIADQIRAQMRDENEHWIDYMRLDQIVGAEQNAKEHDDAGIQGSMSGYGTVESPTLDDRTGRLVAGHGRIDAFRALRAAGREMPRGLKVDADGMWLVPVERGWASRNDDEARAYVLASNHLTTKGGWDEHALLTELEYLDSIDMLERSGFDQDEYADLVRGAIEANDDGGGHNGYGGDGANGTLAERFLIPPFSVLDARKGWWQARKKEWIAAGLRSEETRDDAQVGGFADAAQRAGTNQSGVSIFDPVLCEIAYRWWCPAGGTILDPFAGGSVRGIVAAQLGHNYHGIDLRADQVAANRDNAGEVLDSDKPVPTWYVGDATAVEGMADLPKQVDMLFSCPPYADLEVYSDDPADLSTMPYPQFRNAYADAIRQACARLRDDAFAVWVVGEARGKDGEFYGLIPDTIAAFRAAGLQYVTEAILVTAVATAAIRAARGFSGTRALARTHQNVLIFCKGDKKRATTRLGDVDVADALNSAEEDLERSESGDVDAADPAATVDHYDM